MKNRTYVRKMREFREKANYTQQEISDLLCVQRQTYCNYENGLRMPSIEVMIRLTEIYSISMDSLTRDIDARLLSAEQRILLDEFSQLCTNDQGEILQTILAKRQTEIQ
ncbi:MAG: helix-turn-helix domain-containing protein [Clostridiales bacterium]|nr:helix-turn-helix domain-containing protein [Clostridiales bacterium]MCC8105474.1 helix-turn-helix domain-containing protein [Clostridiales bacterium]